MNEITLPIQSKSTLVKAVVVALALSLVTYFAVILPAEFNSDPTGIGEFLGLTALSQDVSQEQAKSATIATQAALPDSATYEYSEDEVTVIVPPNRGVEYKFQLPQYGSLIYEWKSDGESLYFDFHGEPEGDTSGYFESYTIATTNAAKGSMTVPFAGSHGWYWKNNGDKAVNVILKTRGKYRVIGEPG